MNLCADEFLVLDVRSNTTGTHADAVSVHDLLLLFSLGDHFRRQNAVFDGDLLVSLLFFHHVLKVAAAIGDNFATRKKPVFHGENCGVHVLLWINPIPSSRAPFWRVELLLFRERHGNAARPDDLVFHQRGGKPLIPDWLDESVDEPFLKEFPSLALFQQRTPRAGIVHVGIIVGE